MLSAATVILFLCLHTDREFAKKSLEAAGRAYREASNAAHFLGNLQKAIVYGEKALALSEELGNPRLKLATLSSLVWAHRSARDFTKVEELIELALKNCKRMASK